MHIFGRFSQILAHALPHGRRAATSPADLPPLKITPLPVPLWRVMGCSDSKEVAHSQAGGGDANSNGRSASSPKVSPSPKQSGSPSASPNGAAAGATAGADGGAGGVEERTASGSFKIRGATKLEGERYSHLGDVRLGGSVAPFRPEKNFSLKPQDLMALFTKIDHNVSGSISRDELREALQGGGEVAKMVGAIPNLAPVLEEDLFERVFAATINTHGSSDEETINFSEFSTFCRKAVESTVWEKMGMPEGPNQCMATGGSTANGEDEDDHEAEDSDLS